VLDNLDRAISHSRETEDAGKLIEGVDLIRKQFLDVLSKFGVTVLESLGQPFDPHRHQAVGQVETDEEENRVVREAQKGYFLHDRLLRPSMVVVSKGRAQTRENDSSAPESRAGENSSGSERRGGPNG
jgi:molecular chaperone GrpE